MDDNLSRRNREAKGLLAGKDQSKGRGELGYITLLILILVAIFSSYGLEMYVKAHSENKIARREVSSRQAIYGAEGGIEWAKVMLEKDPAFMGGEISIGEGTVKVKVIAREGDYTVTSLAQYGRAQRKLKVELEKVDGRWLITKYQEIHGNE